MAISAKMQNVVGSIVRSPFWVANMMEINCRSTATARFYVCAILSLALSFGSASNLLADSSKLRSPKVFSVRVVAHFIPRYLSSFGNDFKGTSCQGNS